MKKNHRILHDFLLGFVYVFYIAILFVILFRTKHETRIVKLVPFGTICSSLSKNRIFNMFYISNLFGNILLFIPLGIFLTLFSQGRNRKKNILWVFLISLFTEIAQYVFKMGVADVDDVILNTLGGLIGIYIDKILLLKLENEDKVKKITEIAGIIISFLIAILYYMMQKTG